MYVLCNDIQYILQIHISNTRSKVFHSVKKQNNNILKQDQQCDTMLSSIYKMKYQ